MPHDPRPIVLVDMDGTLADVGHRLHHVRAGRKKNWSRFFEAMDADPANPQIVAMVKQLAAEHRVVIVTGRPEHYRQRTLDWLRRHDVPFDEMHMRPDGDHRPDHIVKKEMLATLGPARDQIALVIDDRPSVCDMWRGCGLKVHQVPTNQPDFY
jgi:phosphoglycolate phosphatase-like HAD superfamily hydrolase